MIYSLDTNIIVDLLRGKDPKLATKYLSRAPREYSVAEMARAELLYGAELSANPAKNKKLVVEFLAPLRLLSFAGDSAEHYADIRAYLQSKGTPIGPNDLVIAATVRAAGHTLVTRNTGEFERVPLLLVEKW